MRERKRNDLLPENLETSSAEIHQVVRRLTIDSSGPSPHRPVRRAFSGDQPVLSFSAFSTASSTLPTM